ncbi:MAG: DUF885 family protein [Deltaproteobacteria bacterium]|jgi:uncharacterized protein (DUF885 family)|nr:DUF885 family protein [Deltaproteobacteria bacterium]MBW2478640.1 DUF885 family protein [Deltaproteobacteria bacterium]
MPERASHILLAQEYFDELAGRFPVMCASDEFHFLPRAQAAVHHYDRLDELDSSAIAQSIEKLKYFQEQFARLDESDHDLETRIDLQMLQANIAGFLIEFDHKRLWQFNPLLYLKVVFIGLDHALTKPAENVAERNERLLARLSDARRVLGQAVENITTVPATYHQASRAMAGDCRHYLTQVGKDLAAGMDGASGALLSVYLEQTAAALDDLERFLADLTPLPDREFAVETLPQTLKDHFLSARSVDDIYQMAVEDWHRNLNRLEALKGKIDPSSSWQDLYHGYLPADIEKSDTIVLYQEEIGRLRRFFRHQGFHAWEMDAPLEIVETPEYLRSVRGAASFAAAFTPDRRESSLFYITTQLAGQNTASEDLLLKKRFHREFKPLTAHETIPGHHLLDAIRRRLENPVRRQIESPLFYEGWASYAEFLLIDSGYITHPMDLLVDYKRRLWRSARCQVDVGLTTGKIDLAHAVHLLETCGFSRAEARRQVDRFRLNPGYQLCYSLGCHEFKQLKASYGTRMEAAQFHQFLLEGGELPFHLIDLRFKELLSEGNKN